MKLPRDVFEASLSRLPLLARDELDAQGQEHYDTVVSPQSRTLVGLRGPSGIWLHSPKLAGFLRSANQYLRFETALDRRLTELAILVTARELDNQFEWAAHEPAALAEGLEARIIDVVKRRKPLGRLGKQRGKREAVIIAFGRELFARRKLSSATFARGRSVRPPRRARAGGADGQLRDDRCHPGHGRPAASSRPEAPAAAAPTGLMPAPRLLTKSALLWDNCAQIEQRPLSPGG